MNMKGITPIIAIVLLLAITIAIVAFSFTYFQRIVGTGFEKSQQQIANVSFGKAVVIDTIDTTNDRVYLRNVGSESITPGTELIVYKDGEKISCDWLDTSDNPITTVDPNQAFYCNATTDISTCGKIKVTFPGGYDEMSC